MNSKPVTECQICSAKDLESVLFLGYIPPVNMMPKVGDPAPEVPSFPAELLFCPKCQLVQLGCIVDPRILFPPEYPYTSGTTKILRDNFADLYQEAKKVLELRPEDLAVDIGSNDGTLLSNFKNGGHKVHGIEPSDRGLQAQEKDIPTLISFFNKEAVRHVNETSGRAKVITATNVFAHIEHVHEVLENILELLAPKGVFISESHYLFSLIETLQYDTIYHEHLRYYSLTALNHLFGMHGMEIIHARNIPTHGGSIRVYAARKGQYPVRNTAATFLTNEKKNVLNEAYWKRFKDRVLLSKLKLHEMFLHLKSKGKKIYGVGAPSRASTLINYVGIGNDMVDCILEVKDSYKVGKYIPGTRIPVVEEARLQEAPPDYALFFSWHIADELAPKFAAKGFKGKIIVPLPEPRII